MAASFDAKEFLAGFLAEADEHLTSANANLLALEDAQRKGQAHPRAVRELFRSLHTIKGLSAMVGVEPVVDVAHAMESVLRVADRLGVMLSGNAVDALIAGTRAIEERIRALEHGRPVASVPPALLDALHAAEPQAPGEAARTEGEFSLDSALLAKLGNAEREQLRQGLASGRRAFRVDFVPSSARAAQGITITTVRERLGAVSDLVKVVPLNRSPADGGGIAFAVILITDALPETLAEAAVTSMEALQPITGPQPAVPLLDEGEPAEAETERAGVIRVEVARLDDALEKLSALVVTRYRLERATADLSARGIDVRELQQVVAENARQLRHLRAAITRARMVSVGDMLQRVPLLVRGLARQTGKKVRLELDAGRAELDKGVAERIFPAIVHLVRNAVDHALESPEERAQHGKPEEGLVRISCHERGNNQLELSVQDDGRGIDREKAARRANRPLPTNDAALLDLICTPGLSTMDETTRTSGRGMGMDIVRRVTTEQLGGELNVASELGVGTTFTLRVPLTVTIVDAFLFLSGTQRYAVPVAGVEEIVDLTGSTMAQGPSPDGEVPVRLLERRGTPVPLLSLEALFDRPHQPGHKAIVIRRGSAPFAFEVDRMLGQQEVVVRPLEDPLVRRVGLSGATDVGDGRPTLVLDLVGLSGQLAALEGRT